MTEEKKESGCYKFFTYCLSDLHYKKTEVGSLNISISAFDVSQSFSFFYNVIFPDNLLGIWLKTKKRSSHLKTR